MLTSMGLGARRGGQRDPVLPGGRPPPTQRRRPGPGRRARCRRPAARLSPMRVLVAMSGGVDSSVAAALLAERLRPGTRWSGPRSSCGAARPTRAAARWPTSRTPGGWPTSSGWSTTSSTSPPTSRSGWSTPTCGATPRAGPPTPASSATATSSSTGCSSGPGRWVSTPWPPATTPGAWPTGDGRFRLCRGADPLKDQSYVLAMLGQDQLARTLFPVGEMTKAEVRAEAHRLGLRTAAKPDSQDVCFIRSDEGRQGFLGRPGAAAPGPAGRPRHRRGPRCGRRRGAGHGGPAPGDGPRPRRSPPVRDRGGRPRPAGHARPARGRPRRPRCSSTR